MSEQTRRELLEAAWDETEKDDDDDSVAVLGEQDPTEGSDDLSDEPKPDGESLEDSGSDAAAAGSTNKQKIPDNDGKSIKGKKDAKVKEGGTKPKIDETQQTEADAARADSQKDGGVKPESVTDKAPQSWKPAAREHWGKIPAEARAEISRRELQVQQTLSQTAQVRKFASDFADTVNPFGHLIRAQHSTPLAAVKNLMETAAGLMQGSASQKASIVAEIIGNYGVDCEVLDNILSELAKKNGGKIPARSAQPIEQVPSWAKPILDMHQSIQESRNSQQEQARQEAAAEIEKMEAMPFFNDVSDDVADLMQISAQRGKVMTIDQAYKKALQLNPEVSKIIAQRKAAADASKGSINKSRRAASTISGAPSGKSAGAPQGANEKLSRKEQLREAWNDAE